MTTRQPPKLTEPLGTVISISGGLLLALTAVGATLAFVGSASYGGFGRGLNGIVCVAQPNTGYSGDGWTRHLGVAGRPGTSISINGTLQACTSHPSLSQRTLDTLMTAPGTLVWGLVLLMLWLVLREARRNGPFTVRAAVAMRRLGWLIIGGSLAAAVAQGAAQDQLLNTLLVQQDHFNEMINAPIHALPVPVLAGAAVLTIARIIRVGAHMDDEIKSTV